MTWLSLDLIKDLITLFSVIAAVLAWVAKLRWSKEYTDAKDAVITAKEEQIKTKQTQIEFLERQIISLQEQTPQKLRDYYKSAREHLGEIIEELGSEVKELKAQLASKDAELEVANERQTSIQQEIKAREEQIREGRAELMRIKNAQYNAEKLSIALASDIGHRFTGGFPDEQYDLDLDLDDEDQFTPRPDDPTVENMVEWFLENYKDPADGVPWEDGEYIYVYGGPYHAEEE